MFIITIKRYGISNGKSHINTFKYKDSTLEIVKSYCYLDMSIKYSGHIGGPSKFLMEKIAKAFLTL